MNGSEKRSEVRLVPLDAGQIERLRLIAAQLDELDAALIFDIQTRFEAGLTEEEARAVDRAIDRFVTTAGRTNDDAVTNVKRKLRSAFSQDRS